MMNRRMFASSIAAVAAAIALTGTASAQPPTVGALARDSDLLGLDPC